MKRKIKCPQCGREVTEKLCFCGWDLTVDFVAYPSVSRIHEETTQFHKVTNIYIEKAQEMRKSECRSGIFVKNSVRSERS